MEKRYGEWSVWLNKEDLFRPRIVGLDLLPLVSVIPPPRLTMELPSSFQPAHPSNPGAKIKWRFYELSQPATVAWRLAPFCPWLTGHVSAPRMASFDPIIISLVVGHFSLVAVESDSPLSSSGPSLPRLPTDSMRSHWRIPRLAAFKSYRGRRK